MQTVKQEKDAQKDFAKTLSSVCIYSIYSSNKHLLTRVLLSSVEVLEELLWREVRCGPCPQEA